MLLALGANGAISGGHTVLGLRSAVKWILRSPSFKQGGILIAAESVAQVPGKGKDGVRPQKIPANQSCHVRSRWLGAGPRVAWP